MIDFRSDLIGDLSQHEEAMTQSTRTIFLKYFATFVAILCDWLRVSLAFSSWSYVGSGDKMRKLSIINQVLPSMLGQLLQKLLIDFLDCYFRL